MEVVGESASKYLLGGNRATSATSKSGGSTTRRGHDEGLREPQLALVGLLIWGNCAGNSMQGCGGHERGSELLCLLCSVDL